MRRAAGYGAADYVVGVSAGIAYGVSYVSRQRGRNLEILTRFVNDKRYMGFYNLLRRGNRSYFGLEFIYTTIPDELVPFDYDAYAAYPGQVEAVVTNLDTGRAEYLPVPPGHDEDKVLQATCALPLLFPVYTIGGRPCLDGGAADAIPYERAFDQGCDRVVVVLTRERDYRRAPEKLQTLLEQTYRRYPRFCDTMRRRAETYNAAREKLFQLEREGRAMVFAPAQHPGLFPYRAGRGKDPCAVAGRLRPGPGASGRGARFLGAGLNGTAKGAGRIPRPLV